MARFILPAGHRFEFPAFEHLAPRFEPVERELWKDYLRNNVRALPEVDLFLYLSERDHVETWVNGGNVPLNAARKYLSKENKGVLTVDELTQTIYKDDDGNIADGSRLDGVIRTPTHHAGMFISVIDCVDPHGAIPNVHLEKRIDDALLLCMSIERSSALAKRLGKSFCVRISNFPKLRQTVETAVKSECRFGPVRYRSDRNRSHFVKGAENEYMKEYRIVVPNRDDDSLWVNLPPGVAKEVTIDDR